MCATVRVHIEAGLIVDEFISHNYSNKQVQACGWAVKGNVPQRGRPLHAVRVVYGKWKQVMARVMLVLNQNLFTDHVA